MEHIKTPVQVCDSEIINLYYVRDADGDRVTTKIMLEEAREIAVAFNEREDLIKQRAALVAAREKIVEAERVANDDFNYQYLCEATDLAHAALALVKGDDDTP